MAIKKPIRTKVRKARRSSISTTPELPPPPTSISVAIPSTQLNTFAPFNNTALSLSAVKPTNNIIHITHEDDSLILPLQMTFGFAFCMHFSL
jgi:hypothetical protein